MMAAPASHSSVRLVAYLNYSPIFFPGFVALPHLHLPLSFTSVSGSRSCSSLSSSLSYAPSRDPIFSHGHNRSSSVRHIISAVGLGTRTEGSDIDDGQEDILEQLGIPRLGSKERKELRAYAHGLGTKLNVQQVGKLGVSQTVVKSISDALEANEILKVKVLENCGSDMNEIIAQLERGTRGQAVGKIGRTVLLYRASQRKLAAAEKRLPEKTRPRRK